MICIWDRRIISALFVSWATLTSTWLRAQSTDAPPTTVAGGQTQDTATSSKDYYPAIDGVSQTPGKVKKETPPVFYAARRFSIPFSVASTGRQPVEVQLLLSRDGGEKWETYERARPEARGFSFAAEDDGGFWFSLRTIDERGMAYPNQNEMLYVVIDTTKPDIGLTVDMNHNGEIIVQCTIAELWIDPNSVVLEYQTDSELKWNAIPVEFKPGSIPGLFAGEKTWQPDVAVRNMMVRLSAADRAGNKSEITRMYSVPRTAARGGLQLASQKQGRSEGPATWPQDLTQEQRRKPLEHTPGASPWSPDQTAKTLQEEQRTKGASDRRILANAPVTPNANARSTKNLIAEGGSAASQGSGNSKRSMAQWESAEPNRQAVGDEPAAGQIMVERVASHPSQADQGQTAVGAPPTRNERDRLAAQPSSPTAQSLGRLTAAQEDSGELRLSDSVESDATSVQADTESRTVAEVPNESAGAEELPAPQPISDSPTESQMDRPSLAPAPLAPNGPQMFVDKEDATQNAPAPRSQSAKELETQESDQDPHAVPMGPTEQNTYYSRAKSFSLDYDIDITRGSAVSNIELWGTMDDGKTWSKWGEDEDRESPFDIRVDEEGMFGFRVVIVGSNLVASNQPRSGDPADAWIYVDIKAPDVKIISAVYGAGNEAGHLVIDYACADEQLIDRPISISFSDRRDGPWTTVASGLKNTGRYLWPAEPNLPKRIYLRMEAVDRAANIGVYRLDLPIDVEGLTPRGRIKGFRPITD